MLHNAAVQDIVNKGKGIVALNKIDQHQLILEENPVIILETPDKTIREDITKDLWMKYDKLSDENKDKVKNLCPDNCPVVKNVQKINATKLYLKFKSNAFVNTETEDFNLFITARRFNHSCLPNVGRDFSTDPDGNTIQRFFAIRDIKQGEELEICYNTEEEEYSRLTEERQLFYFENNDFMCSCCLCLSEDSEKINKVRLDIYRMIEVIDQAEDPVTGIYLIKKLFETFENNAEIVAPRQDFFRIYAEMGFNAACESESIKDCEFFGKQVLFYSEITKGLNHESVSVMEIMLRSGKFEFLE